MAEVKVLREIAGLASEYMESESELNDAKNRFPMPDYPRVVASGDNMRAVKAALSNALGRLAEITKEAFTSITEEGES